MRHGNKVNHLGRKSEHRKAMLSNMANSLIEHKRINTTVAKAKALRGYVEPLITKSKTDSTHSRRTVFSYLKSKEAVSALFRDIAPKVATRNGGYTRIIRTGFRLGDNAEMCLIELVDFNELLLNHTEAKKTTRRSRRGSAGTSATDVVDTTVADDSIVSDDSIESEVFNDDSVSEIPSEESSTETDENTEETK
jgi:large subunit ribosomal protein L17